MLFHSQVSGVRVAVDRKEQIKLSKEKVNKNTNLLKWRLKNVECNVLQQLTYCLARSLLIYIGTPMVAVGLWKRQDIDRFEASIYRKILGAANDVSNDVILNTMTQMRLAGDAISQLSKNTWEQFKKQNRITQYFEKKETNDSIDLQPLFILKNKLNFIKIIICKTIIKWILIKWI